MSPNYDRRLIDFGDNQCHWCGHEPHATTCQGSIFTKAGDKPCPCQKNTTKGDQ